MVSQIDWMSSFAQLLNVTLPAGAGPDSEKQLDAWLGKDKAGREYVIEQNVNNNLSIRTRDWKYIAPGERSRPIYSGKYRIGQQPGASTLPVVR